MTVAIGVGMLSVGAFVAVLRGIMMWLPLLFP
jgi:hypothetical protein